MATPIPANRASFTLTEIAHVTGGRIVGPGQGAVCGVVTDSRRVTPGSLFVALQGEHHDAHRFLPQVAEAGAAAALVMPGRAVAAPTVAIEVPDTLAALGSLAAHHRRAWGGTVVAITGSAGKTTTKELTAAALAATGLSVARTVGNLNNRIGVPMTLLALDASSELAVVEMGTSAPGEIATLAVMTDPQVGVVTTVAVAHSQGLGSLAGVAQEKLSLLAALGRHGVAVYGIDSEPLRRYGQSAPIERA
ncbi:MAG: Mur ligase family protein, partial [Myxococcales bacterium]|nr:Mur ligase family protein [Myxococcales bacterium]